MAEISPNSFDLDARIDALEAALRRSDVVFSSALATIQELLRKHQRASEEALTGVTAALEMFGATRLTDSYKATIAEEIAA